MHAQMKHTLANLQDLANPYVGWFVLLIIMPAKIGIKSCRFARECVLFVHAWMYLPSWNCVCMINYVACYLFPYFLS